MRITIDKYDIREEDEIQDIAEDFQEILGKYQRASVPIYCIPNDS